MSHINERWLEQQRSWLRPDYERYLRPDRARYENPGAAQQTAAPNSRWLPLAYAEHEQKVAHEEQVSLADLQRERLWLMRQKLVLRELYDLQLRLKALNPSQGSHHYLYQPRIPKHNPGGGRWTREGGIQVAGPWNGVQSLLDSISQPHLQLVLHEKSRYTVDLDYEEMNGGHSQHRHVGWSDERLLSYVRARVEKGLWFDRALVAHGSFASRESANDFVNRTLESNRAIVDQVADGKLKDAFIAHRFGFKTGREAFRPAGNATPYLRDTYNTGVYIIHDPRADNGYRVITAYPHNREF